MDWPDSQILHLTFGQQTGPATWPAVSLCMIVKDEEDNLAGCLESVGDFPGEIIVVDTGSTDRTAEIARSFGARVEYFQWIDDFAAARNESLKYAGGDWIFWLDADNRLSSRALNGLKNAVVSGQADGYMCQMVSPLNDGINRAVNRVYYNLLFRRHPGIRFEDPIHESVTEAMLRQGMRVAYTDITVEHSGYSGDSALLRRKAARNIRILRKCAAKEPHRLKWRYHLGVSLYQLEKFAEAADQFEVVVNHPAPQLGIPHLYKAYVLLVSAHTTIPNLARAAEILQQALTRFPERRHLWITAGMFYSRQNRPDQAVAHLERAATLSPESDALGESWADGVLQEQLAGAYYALGISAMQQQNFVEALTALQRVLESSPAARSGEIYKLLAVCLNRLGREEEAMISWQLAQKTGV